MAERRMCNEQLTSIPASGSLAVGGGVWLARFPRVWVEGIETFFSAHTPTDDLFVGRSICPVIPV